MTSHVSWHQYPERTNSAFYAKDDVLTGFLGLKYEGIHGVYNPRHAVVREIEHLDGENIAVEAKGRIGTKERSVFVSVAQVWSTFKFYSLIKGR